MFVRVLRCYTSPLLSIIASLPFEILGLFIIPFMYRLRETPYIELPELLLPWANPEDWTGGWRGHKPSDGCIPHDLREEFSGFWGFYRYHALRNRAHGLRAYHFFVETLIDGAISFECNRYLRWYKDWYISKEITPKPGDTFWHVTWQGKRSSLRYIRYFEFRGQLWYLEHTAGWRLNPTDALHGYNERSLRWLYGASPTIQPLQIKRSVYTGNYV